MKQTIAMVVLAGVVALAGLTWTDAAAQEATPPPKGDIYMLTTCPVSGEELGSRGEPIIKSYGGREVRFCCEGCVSKFEADKEAYWKKIDAAEIKEQKKLYPLDTCLVSGQKLGSMGEIVDKVYKNRLVRFCCGECPATFEKDPANYLKKLDAAVIEKQKDSYPVKTCVVSGEKLGSMGDPVDYVAGNRLVRFCCKDCVKAFEADPQKYLSKLEKESAPSREGS